MRPVVAIVGRPNVGKSTLFNRIIGRRKALVDDQPGVTRDRNYEPAEHEGRRFIVVDTGGFEPDASEGVFALMKRQVEIALAEADCLVVVMDGREGLTPSDEAIWDLLRSSSRPRLLAINKIDAPAHTALAADFYRLGVGEVFEISAANGSGVGELLDRVVERLGTPDRKNGGIRPPLHPRGLRCGDPHAQVTCAAEQAHSHVHPGALPTGRSNALGASPCFRSGVLGPEDGADVADPGEDIRIAIIGRPNVGKSTLANALLGSERFLTSDSPGTTRDAVDTAFQVEGRRFVLVDTAGVRRRKNVDAGLERMSVTRAIRAAERCHVAVLVMDASEGVTDQDKKLAAMVLDRGRGLLFVLNKWDRVEPHPKAGDEFRRHLRSEMPFAAFVPSVFTSALNGRNVLKVVPAVERVHANLFRRVPTHELNLFFEEVVKTHPPTISGTRVASARYLTQVDVDPPVILLFMKGKALVPDQYLRFLERNLRERYDFTGVPLRLVPRRGESERSTS